MYAFIGHENWRRPFPPEFSDIEINKLDEIKVSVIRSLLFFYAGETTTLEKIRAHFTDFAIGKLVHDKFIEIHG